MKKTLIFFILIILAGLLTGTLLALWEDRDRTDNSQEPGTENSPPSIQEEKPPAGAFAVRAIVEGFYGTPWTMDQRQDMFSFMARHHFNTYIYAPKDDPYQRARWWEPYPDTELEKLKKLVKFGESEKITFVYSLSPGIPEPIKGETLSQEMIDQSITFTSEQDFQKLLTKVKQLHGIGIRTVMLSFDDVRKTLKPADQQVYGSDYAAAHVDLANRLLKEGKAMDAEFELWFVPTTYYGLKDNAYWQRIRNHLDSRIEVIWTGSWVLAKEISSSQVKQVNELLGRKLIIWDNYPVNDYTDVSEQKPRLLLGPLLHRSPDLAEVVSGYMANPMVQPESSKIPLATTGAYLWDPLHYKPGDVWEKAIAELAGVRQSADWQKFCTYSSASILTDNAGSSHFSQLAESFWQEYQSNKGRIMDSPTVNQLRQELTALSNLSETLGKSPENKVLYTEAEPWINKLSQAGRAGLLALDYLQAPAGGTVKSQIKKDLEYQLQDLTKNRLHIGTEVLSFCRECLK